ncbi:signal peptidase II [Nocardia vinacea]|uniref:Lipoprotein signal peptidase n=1 Tax=Nocardia vinacea TaxID=96468 RepID=A0ABZ1YPR2_9NOCA|nr:signal peptidase II [Nocardia vinacea]
MMVGVSDDRPPEDKSADSATPPSDDAENPTPTADPGKPAAPLRLRTLLIIAAVLLGLDLLTKTIVVAELTPGDPVPIIGDFARLSLVRNPGAAFSMATGMTWLLTLVAAAVVIGVIRIGRTLRSLWWAIGLGMVLGGALGNLVDRLFRAPGPLQGHVVDFIAVGWWPVFNLADSSIVCGAILLVVLTVFGFEPDGTRAGHDHSEETATETAAEPGEPSDNGANGAAGSKGNAA